MIRRGSAVAVALLLAACGGADEDLQEEVVFRVGATAGLSQLVPGAPVSGSSAAAGDSVFELADEHIDEFRQQGATVVLTRKSRSRLTSADLASSARYQGLESARALDKDHVELILRDRASIAGLMKFRDVAFDVGPYKIESQTPGHLRLRRRGPSAIDVIDIVEVSASDEWRKLMARELDVMSSSPALFREQFAGMGSIRLLDIPATIVATLFFNVGDSGLKDANVRRRIAASLNRGAIAQVATGDAYSASPSLQKSLEDEIRLPDKLSLLVVEHDSTMVLAASVIRHELGRQNIAIDVKALSLEQFVARLDRGDHQLALGPLPKGPRRFGRFLSPSSGSASMTGFADPAYDAAVARGDLAAAQAILDRETPATLLYERRAFAAIDSRFCGDVTPSDTSWRWMADLHLCDSEKGEGKSTP